MDCIASQCPGKRAAHCYWRQNTWQVWHLNCLNALESGRLIVTLAELEEHVPGIVLSQCPGKRAAHCYGMMEIKDTTVMTAVSMPWKAGGSLLRPNRASGQRGPVKVSMPWKAGGSLLLASINKVENSRRCCLNALESGRLIVTIFEVEPKLEMAVSSQCPGKRAAHCYYGNSADPDDAYKSSQCPGKRAAHCYKTKSSLPKTSFFLSQCPGKRAAHCYAKKLLADYCEQTGCLNALESGRLIVTQ